MLLLDGSQGFLNQDVFEYKHFETNLFQLKSIFMRLTVNYIFVKFMNFVVFVKR